MENFKKHEVDWTREKINNFWDYFVVNEGLRELSFAKTNGEEIVKMVRDYIKEDGKNLDYGCGGGFLMSHLFNSGIECGGLDSSEDSVKKTEEKFKEEKLFKGTILSTGTPNKGIEDNFYDFVFTIEMLEHLMKNELDEVVKEFSRIIKPGGYLFISVPHNENIDKYKVICPDCGSVFHRVQHMNKFTEESLSKRMLENKFKTIICKGTFLGKDQSFYNKIKHFVNKAHSKMFNKKEFKPHLVYLGRKIKD